jgi:hypothetical protein
MALQFESVNDGYRVLTEKGNLLAHVKTRWPNDDHKDHSITWHPLPRQEWSVRWASALVDLKDLDAFLAGLPEE